jgi:lysozyme
VSIPEWVKAIAIGAGFGVGIGIAKHATRPDMQPLIVDLYALDDVGDLKTIGADPRVCGLILKATEGVSYSPTWFAKTWPLARDAGGERYGDTWFRGCYHYLRVDQDAVTQAHAFLTAVEHAGGFDGATWMPFVDVEPGGNAGATAAQVIDVTTTFVNTVKDGLGRPVGLYAGSLFRDLSITDRCGCWKLWTARYSATLPRAHYESMGWSLDDLFAWQYQGTGAENIGRVDGYPNGAQFGSPQLDLSALQMDAAAACAPLSIFVA